MKTNRELYFKAGIVLEKLFKESFMLNYLIIFLISMVPLVELRGALIYSQAIGMPLLASYIICVIGNMLPVPIIYLFARKVLIWGKDKNILENSLLFV